MKSSSLGCKLTLVKRVACSTADPDAGGFSNTRRTEVDLLREAQSLTVPLFAAPTPSLPEEPPNECELLRGEALLHILLQTSDLLTTDNPERYGWRLLAIWHTLLHPSSGESDFRIAALH